MWRRKQAGLLLGALGWALAASAQAQTVTIQELTYEEALTRAREQAPALIAARARAREADSQATQAAVWRQNPQVAGAAGRRRGDAGTDVDWFVSAEQWFQMGGQRRERVRAAQAGAAGARARSADAQRRLLHEVARAFVTALYWGLRVQLAERNVALADAAWRVAERRHGLGDLGGLERSAAALARTQVQASADLARLARSEAVEDLSALLGTDPGVQLVPVGELAALAALDERTTDTLQRVGDVQERPDLVALRAERAQASAQAELADSQRVPDLALAARYGREEGDEIVRGTLTLAVPLFDRGQGARAVAEARTQRIEAELSATERSAAARVAAIRERAAAARRAAERFEQSGLALLARTEQQATESYELGATPLAELLVLRRELVRARIDHAGLLLAAAAAHVDLAAVSGAMQ